MTSSSQVKNEPEKSSSNTSNASTDNPVKKIVIRRLPPTLTKEQFLDIVSPLPEYDYFYFCNGDMSLGSNAFCRAYICFKNHQDVFNFRDRFDNYVFVDSKSNEYPALVEYAPYQRRFKFDPQNPPKKDSKCNTIDQDTDYMKFLENFDKPSGEQLPSCEAILEELEQKEKDKVSLGLLAGTQAAFTAPKIMTPLLEYMKKKREDKKSSKDKDRDRDRDNRSNRRRDRDRDRDNERYGGNYGSGGGGGNKRRDEYYYSNYQSSRDYNSKNQSSSSSSQKSSQPKITLATKSDSKMDSSSNIKILNKPQSQTSNTASNSNSSNKNHENDSKLSSASKSSNNQSNNSNKDNRPNSAQSSNSYKNSSNYGYKNNSNYNNNNNNNNNSSNRNSSTASGSGNSYKDKGPSSSSNNQSSTDSKSSNPKDDKLNKDQNDKDNQKSVKNKDRPSIQIYNPAQRAAMRQQRNQN